MALGGGIWTNQDKVLPGTYINFANPARVSSSLSERGVVAVPLNLSWGPEDTIFELEAESIGDKCRAVLGYELSSPEMLPIRELFKNARKLLCYRLQKGAQKAANSFAQAKYAGVRGNDIKTIVAKSVDRTGYFRVSTLLNGLVVDSQEAKTAAELKDNDYVSFLPEASLTETPGLALTGGTQGQAVTGAEYTAFLQAAESYSFNILCCPVGDADTVSLFIAYSKRLCEESGAGFQLVCYRPQGTDWEGVIGVENQVISGLPESGLVYWVAGAQAACPLNQSLTGRRYDGELSIDLAYSQNELKAALSEGKFLMHGVNGSPRVLRDINTLVSFTDRKGQDFSSNQTIRVCSGLGARVAELFNGKYLGSVSNDESGRISLWNDICRILTEYRDAHAIEEFSTEDVEVLPGDNKKSVLCRVQNLSISGAMEALYVNIMIQ